MATVIAFSLMLSSAVFQDEHWVAPIEADQLTNPMAGNEKAIAKGKKIYQKLCWSCHGINGTGEGPASEALVPKPANYTSAMVQNQSDGAIFWKITYGRGQMASFKQSLSDEQRWMLVNYVRVLSNGVNQ